MKKRLFSLLLALLLLLCVSPASAVSSSVYFTAANDTLLELSDSTMPFWSGGYLYVPSTVFTGKEFGIAYSRNLKKNTVMLYSSRNSLIFDLNNESCSDNQGNIYIQPCILRGNLAFLPISLVANIFSLTYTSTKINFGYLIRIKGGSSVLSDSIFIDAASEQMAYRYAQYQKSGIVAKPLTPAPEPPPAESPQQDEKNLYLCFLVTDTAAAEAQISALGSARATFYLPVTLLPGAGDLARRIVAQGHAIGLAADASAGDLPEQLRRGNALLSRATGSKTRLVLLQNASAATKTKLRSAGYCILSARVDNSARSLSTPASADALLRRIHKKSGSITVYFGARATAGGLRSFLAGAREAGDRFLVMTELV